MRKRRLSFCFRLILAALFSFSLAQIAAAQVPKKPDDSETLQALLTEVRSLRLALQTLQRMSLDTYRSQLLVDRIRVSREDVRRLTSSLNEARDLIAKTQFAIPQSIDRQKLLEGQAQLEVDQKERAQLEFEARRAKDSIEMYKAQLDPLKEREQQLTADLNIAKSKLEELESRLETIERAIDNDRQKLEDKPGPAKSP
jgi:chromosome segregation ATPase